MATEQIVYKQLASPLPLPTFQFNVFLRLDFRLFDFLKINKYIHRTPQKLVMKRYYKYLDCHVRDIFNDKNHLKSPPKLSSDNVEMEKILSRKLFRTVLHLNYNIVINTTRYYNVLSGCWLFYMKKSHNTMFIANNYTRISLYELKMFLLQKDTLKNNIKYINIRIKSVREQ